MNSSNPVLGRLTQRADQHSGLRREPAPHAQPGYAGPGYDEYSDTHQHGAYPTYAPGSTGRMSIDDVVLRTAALLGIVGVVGALSWILIPVTSAIAFPLLLGAGLTAMIAALVISFKQVTNPFVISAFAALEGVFVGMFSHIYADAFGGGIVLQAVVGTFGVFVGMALIYKARIIRATPKFARWMTGFLIGAVVLVMLNLGLALFGFNDGTGLGLRSGGPIAILFSIGMIALASLTFILDFAAIEEGERAGLPTRYAWYCSFGLLVSLVWLYLEILRLLGYLRD